ncbi:MAG: hypothetical protein D6767_00690 [Candidatus Hydrogenedentota bacterium]|nr:MAG: hypothetical protein D6767_00690 [Candidatus Hydrogenedentota bacterium]
MALIGELKDKENIFSDFHIQKEKFSWESKNVTDHKDVVKQLTEFASEATDGYVEYDSQLLVLQQESFHPLENVGKVQRAVLARGNLTMEVARDFDGWHLVQVEKGTGEEFYYIIRKQLGNSLVQGKNLVYECILGKQENKAGILLMRFAGLEGKNE